MATGNDGELDFCSKDFNPLKALKAEESQLVLPCPDVPPCYSLIHYQEIMRRQNRREKPQPQEVETTTQLREKRKPPQRIKSVLTYMPNQTYGPLSVLRLAMTEKSVMNVWIRHSAGVRGVCIGKIRAFDRHWNIVMYDVTECYTPLRTASNGGKEPKPRRRVKRRKKNAPAKGIDDDCSDTRITSSSVTCESIDTSELTTESILDRKESEVVSLSRSESHGSCIKDESLVNQEKSTIPSLLNEKMKNSKSLKADVESISIRSESVASDHKLHNKSVSSKTESHTKSAIDHRQSRHRSTTLNDYKSTKRRSRSLHGSTMSDSRHSSTDKYESYKPSIHKDRGKSSPAHFAKSDIKTTSSSHCSHSSVEKSTSKKSPPSFDLFPGNAGSLFNTTNWETVRRVKQLFIRGDNIVMVTAHT